MKPIWGRLLEIRRRRSATVRIRPAQTRAAPVASHGPRRFHCRHQFLGQPAVRAHESRLGGVQHRLAGNDIALNGINQIANPAGQSGGESAVLRAAKRHGPPLHVDDAVLTRLMAGILLLEHDEDFGWIDAFSEPVPDQYAIAAGEVDEGLRRRRSLVAEYDRHTALEIEPGQTRSRTDRNLPGPGVGDHDGPGRLGGRDRA